MLFPFAVNVILLGAITAAQLSPDPTYTPPPAASATAASSSDGGGSAQWGNLLGNALYFYDVQRSGRLPSHFRVDWRNDSVLNDGSDVGIDLSGGFFDAGNFIKATLPLCWVMTWLSWGGLVFGKGYDASRQTAYLDETLRTGFDWILQASSKPDQLVVMVGGNDTYWGGDGGIPTNTRQALVVTRQNPGTDVFGSCAGALAAGAMLYDGTSLPLGPSDAGSAASLQNSTYASTLLSRAQSLFNMAQTADPKQLYQKATNDAVSWAYKSSNYDDELVVGAAFLAGATGNKSYAEYAQQQYSAASYPVSSGVLNWDSHAPAAPVLLAQLALSQPDLGLSFSKYQADSEVWLDNIVNGKMSNTFTTKGGLFWFDGDSDPASLNPALNAAALALIYRGLASSASKASAYLAFATSQIDYLLGKNPMRAVYPVGTHPNSPQNPQSALAAGGTDADDVDHSPPVMAHVLYGGVVGGPDRGDRYTDKRSDYVQSECALDYNAPLALLAAHQVATGADAPYYVTLTEPIRGSDGSGGLSTGAIVGIVIGVVAGVVTLLALLVWWKRDKARQWWRQRSSRDKRLRCGNPGQGLAPEDS